MQIIPMIVIGAGIFGLCYFVDKAFTKAFRSKAQHRSGLAVRAAKRYGIFGVILTALGLMGAIAGFRDTVLLWAGLFSALLGMALTVYYLSFGIFYDGDSFLLCRFGKRDREYFYRDILGQKLYLIQGGNIVVELHMAGGSAVSVQSTMDGIYPFLDTAFAGWCIQTGRDPQSCDFHDPSQSIWFPPVEEV